MFMDAFMDRVQKESRPAESSTRRVPTKLRAAWATPAFLVVLLLVLGAGALPLPVGAGAPPETVPEGASGTASM
ncbi:hypothetical protein BC831DRAFT_451263 [Entophlyctis helioformis]|nr:hypothetical protein BC831DRAFT_451263 [Entophlyctis helioformis]